MQSTNTEMNNFDNIFDNVKSEPELKILHKTIQNELNTQRDLEINCIREKYKIKCDNLYLNFCNKKKMSFENTESEQYNKKSKFNQNDFEKIFKDGSYKFYNYLLSIIKQTEFGDFDNYKKNMLKNKNPISIEIPLDEIFIEKQIDETVYKYRKNDFMFGIRTDKNYKSRDITIWKKLSMRSPFKELQFVCYKKQIYIYFVDSKLIISSFKIKSIKLEWHNLNTFDFDDYNFYSDNFKKS
jgi:hypothetical protein